MQAQLDGIKPLKLQQVPPPSPPPPARLSWLSRLMYWFQPAVEGGRGFSGLPVCDVRDERYGTIAPGFSGYSAWVLAVCWYAMEGSRQAQAEAAAGAGPIHTPILA